MPSILVVDDDPAMLRYTKTLLDGTGYDVETAPSGTEALEAFRNGSSYDAVLLDVMMPDLDGLETLGRLRDMSPHTKVIMMSGHNEVRAAVHAIRLGAEDYLVKPVDGEVIRESLERCLRGNGHDGRGAIIEELGGDSFFLAASPAMRRIRQQVQSIAEVDVPVLLLGESGTGKEVISLLLHKLSARSHRKLLKVNCAAIPEGLLESELFGYEAGAFTGANHPKPGKFELSDRGTILLDEIGEMPSGLQAKLLQVLQEQKFFRLGSRAPVSVDVRILAATNVNIQDAIREGKLRLDLYYRLNAFSITLPPLRDRRDEIPALFNEFMRRMARSFQRPLLPFTDRLQDACMSHHWPGNVRELHNFVKRYLVLGDDALLAAELNGPNHSVERLQALARAQGGEDLKQIVRNLKGEAEAEAIARALQQTNWNRRQAAELLKISYKALVYKSRQYGLLPRKARPKPVLPPMAQAATAD